MIYKLNNYYKVVSVVSGAVSYNTVHLHGDILGIHVKPATNTTTWALNLVGYNGLSVWDSRDTETGEQNIILWSLTAVNEILTIAFSSVSKDEKFEVELRIKEYQV